MEKFKTLATSRLTVFTAGALLALLVAWPLMGTAQVKSNKAKDPDVHAQHKDKQPAGDQDLASQIAELGAKVARLEAALKKSQTSGMGAKKKPAMGMMEDDMDEMGSMQPEQGAPAAGGAGMGMKMDEMMGMMEKMMGGGSMQPASGKAGMGGMGDGAMEMKMDKMMGMIEKMMSGDSMQPAGGKAGMGGGAMGMKMDKMLRMMEKIMSGGSMQPGQAAPAMGAMPHM